VKIGKPRALNVTVAIFLKIINAHWTFVLRYSIVKLKPVKISNQRVSPVLEDMSYKIISVNLYVIKYHTVQHSSVLTENLSVQNVKLLTSWTGINAHLFATKYQIAGNKCAKIKLPSVLTAMMDTS